MRTSNDMKYHVHAKATMEWAFDVEADTSEEAKHKVAKAVEDGEESEFPCEVYDTGALELEDIYEI
jgi:hypothetical protein